MMLAVATGLLLPGADMDGMDGAVLFVDGAVEATLDELKAVEPVEPDS